MTRLFSLIGLLLAAGLQAQSAIIVPSQQSITFLETRAETETNTLRLRFVAPDLESPLDRPSFEEMSQDLQALCDAFAVEEAEKIAFQPTQIVVSLSSKPVEFGVAQTEVEQVFEAFSLKNGSCMLEMF